MSPAFESVDEILNAVCSLFFYTEVGIFCIIIGALRDLNGLTQPSNQPACSATSCHFAPS